MNVLTDEDLLVKEGKLGSGTYSKVYKARNSNGRTVAIKVTLCDEGLDFKCCIRELEINSSLKHPFIVPLEEVREGNPFANSITSSPPHPDSGLRVNSVHFVYSLAISDMYDFIYGNFVDIDLTRKFMCQMLLAVEYLHNSRIIHRDIKIDNFLVFDEGGSKVCKLADFGMAKQFVRNQYQTPGISVSYCRPPECALLRRQYDYKVDIWSLACVFFEMVNKKLPIIISRESCGRLRTERETNILILETLFKLLPNIPRDDILRDYPRANLSCPSRHEKTIYSFMNVARRADLRNRGCFESFHSLMSHMFVFDPSRRFTASQCLDHCFFDTMREEISVTRRDYPRFVRESIKYNLCTTNGRVFAEKAARDIFQRRSRFPWYSHRILFHAISLFDLILTNIVSKGKCLNERQANVYFRVAIYIFVKYFASLNRESLTTFAHLDGSIFLTNSEINESVKFENYVVTIFNYKIYNETIYDRICENGFTEDSDIVSALNFILDRHHNGLTVEEAYRKWLQSRN